jgi:defect-in-organelle-trafficking protein DotB
VSNEGTRFLDAGVPNRFTEKAELDNLLYNLTTMDGSDVFLMSGRPIFSKIHSKKKKLSRRVLQSSEMKDIAEIIGGEGTISDLGSGVAQNASYSFEKEIDGSTKSYRYRVNMMPCLRDNSRGMTITIRNIPTKIPSTSDLAIDQDMIDLVRTSRQGMILCVGATGHGKSSTLASLIADRMMFDPDNSNLVTFEDPVEFTYDYVDTEIKMSTQLEVGRHVKSFTAGLTEAMRMAPDLILVGEIRDYLTMHAAMSAAVSGHSLFSTLHANNIAETLTRMAGFFPPELQHQARMDILSSLSMIVAQRLVPSTDGKRVALREYLILNNEIRERLLDSDNMAKASVEITREKGRLMVDHARQLLDEGRIDLQTFKMASQNYG